MSHIKPARMRNTPTTQVDTHMQECAIKALINAYRILDPNEGEIVDEETRAALLRTLTDLGAEDRDPYGWYCPYGKNKDDWF